MKRIKDERLQMQNLKNIRIAFIFQNVGILAILFYDIITKEFMEAFKSPLWSVFILTSVVFSGLNLKISVDVYDNAHEQKRPGPYYRVLILSALVGTVIALLAKFGPDHSNNIQSLLVGSIVFVCFLIPFSFVYFLRKKRLEENEL